jgi:hypothetical protein
MEKTALQKTTAKDISTTHFAGDRLTQMATLAGEFHKAGCFGSDVQNPQQALVKIQAGYEMGMPPVEAMNSLYIVKGKITLWGTATTKRLREHGWKIEWIKSDKTEAHVKISKGDEVFEEHVKLAEIPSNSQAVKFAPLEKLRWHAIGKLIKFHVPEVLGAGINYLKEEGEDFNEKPRKADLVVEEEESKDIKEYLEYIKNAETIEEITTIEVEISNAKDSIQKIDLSKISEALGKKKDELNKKNIVEVEEEAEEGEIVPPTRVKVEVESVESDSSLEINPKENKTETFADKQKKLKK